MRLSLTSVEDQGVVYGAAESDLEWWDFPLFILSVWFYGFFLRFSSVFSRVFYVFLGFPMVF